MSSLKLFLYALLSGVLLAFAWPEIGFSPLIFIAWIPLYFIEDFLLSSSARSSSLKLFGLSLVSFLVWNVGATYWVKNASLEGALLAFIANSLIMAGVYTLAHGLRKRLPSKMSWMYIPILWIAFEYVHHDWDLSWPWLSLGNSLADLYPLIQWYEFTGIAGGTLWILVVNGLFYRALRSKLADSKQAVLPLLRLPILLILLPSFISLFQYYTFEDKGEKTAQVAIIQPNVDPYRVKFNKATLDDQLESFIKLSQTVVDSTTDWLIGPETALVGSMDEANLEEYARIKRIREFMSAYPRLTILIGAETHRFYMPGEERSATARKTNDPDVFYDSYNTALLFKHDGIEVYHKSKLVPGVEQMPFPWLFKHIESLAIDLGGTTGTLAKQDERTVFNGENSDQRVATAICYESIYGDFMQSYMRSGANFIAIITNDGWWGDTPGYKQHIAYARLRAIESRRSVVRSANTGISAIINQRGDLVQERAYWTSASIKGEIYLNDSLTVFAMTGDVFGLTCTLLSVWLLVYAHLILRFRNRRKTSKLSNAKA